MNKVFLIPLLILITVGFMPLTSSSKDNGPETLVLTKSNLLVLNSEVDGDSVGPIITKAKELDSALSGRFKMNKEPLYLYLNTPGGSVQSGLELIEALKGLGRPVHTITAFSASMGFQIVQNLDNRYILKSGILMSHRAAGQFSGSFGGTNPSQLDQRIHLYVQITKELDEQTVARTNGKQTLESYQKAYNSEMWLTGQEGVASGYADSVARVKCDKSLSGATTHHTQFMGLTISYDLDNCPINTSPLNIRVDTAQGVTPEIVNKVKAEFASGYAMRSTVPLPMVF